MAQKTEYPAGVFMQLVPCFTKKAQQDKRREDGKKPITHEVKFFSGNWNLLDVRQVTAEEVEMQLGGDTFTAIALEAWLSAAKVESYGRKSQAEHKKKK